MRGDGTPPNSMDWRITMQHNHSGACQKKKPPTFSHITLFAVHHFPSTGSSQTSCLWFWSGSFIRSGGLSGRYTTADYRDSAGAIRTLNVNSGRVHNIWRKDIFVLQVYRHKYLDGVAQPWQWIRRRYAWSLPALESQWEKLEHSSSWCGRS